MSETPTVARAPQPQREAPHEEVLLGRYRVLERRGTGGFGTVCTCWDVRLQRRVAIKRMPLLAETGTTAEEALAEARTACMLGHPNIVTVFDFESDGTYAYLVMEYVDGLNLAELLARVEGGRLTPEECAHVLASVSRALSYAHENRVLHLDIKPTNIMIDRRGTVKLADFGMATLASAAGYGGARGGTVGYMPPEQIEGGLVDERTDVFSLAVVVWQALTGSNPFASRNAEESLRRIGHGPGVQLARLCPGLGPGAADVQAVLLNALAPSPAARSASAAELFEDLAPYLGSPTDGATSLLELLEQAEDDGGDAAPVRRWRPPVLGRDRVEGVLTRALTGLTAFAAVRMALPALSGGDERVVAGASLVCCLAAAVWPPLGAPLVAAAFAGALAATGASAWTTFAALAVLVVVGAWWVLAGRREHLASMALLLPCCLPCPVAGAGLAGFALDPLPAALTGGLGCLAGSLFRLAVSASFSPDLLWPGLLATWGNAGFWVVLAGSAACAAASSAVALRGSVAAGVAGQALGLACLVGFEVFAARMENTGIWGALDGESLVVAVLLFVLLCIATVLRGPLYEDQDGGGIHEFSE